LIGSNIAFQLARTGFVNRACRLAKTCEGIVTLCPLFTEGSLQFHALFPAQRVPRDPHETSVSKRRPSAQEIDPFTLLYMTRWGTATWLHRPASQS